MLTGRDCDTVKADGRDGNGSMNETMRALNGTCDRNYYMTPAALYASSDEEANSVSINISRVLVRIILYYIIIIID